MATSRSEERARELRGMGAEAVVLDAFDAGAAHAAVIAARPDAVVHQRTALPRDASPSAMKRALADTARLRRETVPTFAAGARSER